MLLFIMGEDAAEGREATFWSDRRRKPEKHVKKNSRRRRFGWFSVVLVVGYFLAGWWPFNFWPPNHVSWLPDRAGLRFEDDGIVYGRDALPFVGATKATEPVANYTVELWVEAGVKPATDVFHLLTIHDGRQPSQFVLCQWRHEIILRAASRESEAARAVHEVGVDGALEERKSRFITITGSAAGTDFYVDGVLAGRFPEFVLDPTVLNGCLILGNSAAGKHSWLGRFFGLAIYQRALGASEIAKHHTLWTQGFARQLVDAPNLMVLYPFDEGSGRRVEDHSRNRHQMMIPASYQPLQKLFLMPPWCDLSYNAPNYRDIFLNVLGFMPFGFCFFLHRRSLGTTAWLTDALFVLVAGFLISLTIETIQVWLPNRVSSMTDLLGNTAGTLLGVLLALGIQGAVLTAESRSMSP